MNKIDHSLLDKLENNKRLDYEDGLKLYDMSLSQVGKYANKIRRDKFEDKTYFNINRHINPTNKCKDICKFCAYSANRKNPNEYTMNHKEILEIASIAHKKGAKEIHIVSAHNNQVGIDWYLNIFKMIKDKYPKIHIKALTAAEVHFLSQEHNKSHSQILELMEQNGVDSMPGGGAEIFNKKVRDFICKGKVSSEDWIKIHTLWHQKRKHSNATMLFGHIEKREHRIEHMLRLRDLQDITNGFNAFIPLVYQKYNNYLKVENTPKAVEILKTFAISRIMLDNIPNIKAYWATTTMPMALIAQEYGVNDIDGTIQKESIQSAAGAKSKDGVLEDDLIHFIQNSGFRAVERDSMYDELKIFQS